MKEIQFSVGEEDQGHYGGIDLGNIEENSPDHKLVKGNEKSIPTNMADLIDFVATGNASIAVFKININGSMCYFFMYLNIK